MNKCRHCHRPVEGSTHYCEAEGRTLRQDDGDDFILSAIVGAATDSAILGAVLGGSVTGAIIGDLLNGGDLFD